jgi:outer membrane protein assembly factor BamB
MPPTTVLKCAECGAALPSGSGPTLTCAYCGALNRTDLEPHPSASEVRPAAVEASAPLPERERWPEPPRASPPRDHRATPARPLGCGALAVLGLLSLVGFGIFSPSARCMDWVAAPFCEVDANGDGRPDLAMRARRVGGGEKLFALDGRGGAVLWSASALGTGSDEAVFCAGPRAVLAQHADLRIELFGSDGRLIASRAASDRVRSVREGTGCVEIELGDGTSIAASLTGTQSAATCPGAQPSSASDWDKTRAFEKSGATIGGLHVVAGSQGESLVRLVLSADRAGQVAWTRPFEIVRNGVHLAPTRTGVLIAGKRPDGHLRVAWVRASNGEVVYDHSLPEDADSLNDVFAVMVDSADVAYVDVSSRLYVYDVQSGDARWHTGLF